MSNIVRPILLLFLAVSCYGQENGRDPKAKELRAQRLQLMSKRVADLEVTAQKSSQVLEFARQPQFRYSDSVRGILDASVWFLGREGRPTAVLTVEVYRNIVMYEFTATSEKPGAVSAKVWAWKPSNPSFQWLKKERAPLPRRSKVDRLQQMRSIARRYEGKEISGRVKNPIALRLLSQPIHRYSDPENGVIDGAAFALVYGSNVELILFVEAVSDNEIASWQVGFLRMAGARLEVRERGSENTIWIAERLAGTVPNGSTWSKIVPHSTQEAKIFAPQ